MNKNIASIKQQRLDKLFSDCQRQVTSQIIGPFGLSMAMFEDKNGGNVTTLHNFKRDEDDYLATDSDKKLHSQSKKKYDKAVRSEYEVETKESAVNAGEKTWNALRQEKINLGVDDYTNNIISSEGKVQSKDGLKGVDLDHVISIKEIHNDPKIHLSLGKDAGEDGVDVTQIRKVVNSADNLALTNSSANRSKGEKSLSEWAKESRNDGSTNTDKYELDCDLINNKQRKASIHIEEAVSEALFNKQKIELLNTGIEQAQTMGLRQALGVLLTELVNGLFNELKVLIQQGVQAGETLLGEIRQRLARVIDSVIAKIPDAIGQLFEGGISGFISNLLTFFINNFLSTAKRFVTAIREGLLGLYRAFKMIFFPPENLTADQAMQEGLKILAAVVVTSTGFLLNETIATFMATVPLLKPFADLITPVLIGILTGLLSAFLAYQIDCFFNRSKPSLSEKSFDELFADAKRRDDFAGELISLSESSLGNIENYSRSINIYQNIGTTLGMASASATATLISLEKTVSETGEQIARSMATIKFINESQSEIEDFLKTI